MLERLCVHRLNIVLANHHIPTITGLPQTLRLQIRPIRLSIQSPTFLPIRFRDRIIADLVYVPVLIRIACSILPHDFNLRTLVILASVNEPLDNANYNNDKECYYAII